MSVSDQPRIVASDAKSSGLDIAALVLIAMLLAAGFILNATVGKALSITGIQPEFVISSYCLAILLLRPSYAQGALIGLLAATVIQLTTSIPGLEYLCDLPAAVLMVAIVRHVPERIRVMPLVGAFCATLVSGLVFATVGTVLMGADLATVVVKLPIVIGTAAANGVIVEALYLPLKKALKH